MKRRREEKKKKKKKSRKARAVRGEPEQGELELNNCYLVISHHRMDPEAVRHGGDSFPDLRDFGGPSYLGYATRAKEKE
jgi:hypothetical protein